MSEFLNRSLAARLIRKLGRCALAPFSSKESTNSENAYIELILGIALLVVLLGGLMILWPTTAMRDNENRGDVALSETAPLIPVFTCVLEEGLKPSTETFATIEAELVKATDIMTSEVPGVGVGVALIEAEQTGTTCSATTDVSTTPLHGYRNDQGGVAFDLTALPAGVFDNGELTRFYALATEYFLRIDCNGGVMKHYLAYFTYPVDGPAGASFGADFNIAVTTPGCNMAAGDVMPYYGGP